MLVLTSVAMTSTISAQTKKPGQESKPNILLIMGDDIGIFNVSTYNMGMMGYKTPNIDRIGKEGAVFTDWYGQQSCTAGRAAFITGQTPIRTGLTKVGLPGAPEGIKAEDPTIAELLKEFGYATGQFGKNHLGDRDDTNWEGGYRVPCVIRWPGIIKPGTLINEIGAHEDIMETLLAAAGNPNVKEELLTGKKVGNKTVKVHLDGYNLLPALKGESTWPRKEFMYWTDDGQVAALRYGDWKFSFLRQNAVGLDVWSQPFVELRIPLLGNLRMDPFERAEAESWGYERWSVEHAFVLGPSAAYVGQWLQSFEEFPPRQKPGSFNLNKVMENLTNVQGSR